MNKDNENNEVIEFISDQRLERYLRATGGDLKKAFELYRKNMHMSAALYPILSCFEVCVRNKIHKVMTAKYGVTWLIDPQFPMDDDSRAKVYDAQERLHKENKLGDDMAENMGRVIAGLSFGFWASLFNNKYEYIFWRPVLRHAFPNYNGKLRPLRSRIDMIRRLRNRVAHHEPIIFMNDLDGRREAIIETIGWMSEDVRDWVAGL